VESAGQAQDGIRAPEPNALDIYGSLRVRYRSTVGDRSFSDGGSRVGVKGRYQVLPRKWLFARAEVGFNLLDELNALFSSNGNNPDGGKGDTFFRRLLNVGYESPSLFLVFGKTWSVYYKVTGFTDRFEGTGGQAAGTYNAGSDGGYTGTGRAENALQTRLSVDFLPERWGIEPFSLNLQLQDGEPIPGADGYRYGHTVGLSALLATRDHFSFGLAYNHANVPVADEPAVRARGIRGDATALAAGTRWFDDDWYLGTVVARLHNHEATDEGNYFDGWGWEVYAQYRLRGRWWLTGGWNWLQPDGGQPLAGDYRIKYGVLGLRYALKDFERILYVNVRTEGSLKEDGSRVDDVLTVGVRWNF
jgi:predicted porin